LANYSRNYMEKISHLVQQYGYAGIFFLLFLGIVGLPVPDECLMTFVGYLVYKHTLNLVPAFAAAVLGSSCGITVSYGLGRSLGLFLVHHYGRLFRITPENLERVHAWFDRFGTWTLLVGYFIPGVRHLTAVVAGTSKLHPLIFAIFAYSGALIWAATFIGLGFYFGDQWSQVLDQVHRNLTALALIALCAVVTCLIWRYRNKQTRQNTQGQ
jgi:membrane protein DedA with SNARE-associated domain